MDFNLEQFVEEWRRNEGTRTIQADELRAEIRLARKSVRHSTKRLEALADAMRDLPESLKALREVHKTVEELKHTPSKLDKIVRVLKALTLVLALAAFANPVLSSEAGSHLITYLAKKVVP